METRTYRPTQSPVSHLVEVFWQLTRNDTTPVAETIVPVGNVNILFNLHDDPIWSRVGNQSYRLPRCFINGYNTQSIDQTLPIRQTFLGVTLHATAVQRLLGLTADDFADRCTDLTLVHPVFDSLWHQLAEQPTFTGRTKCLSDFLTSRLTQVDKREQAFDRFISDHTDSSLTVNQVADRLCYSPRQLGRKLRALTGLNTEQTLLYKKYLHTLDLIHHSPLSLTEIAHAGQFTDQAHFSKTFKSFTGLSPRAYRARKSVLVGHLFTDVR